MRRNIPFSHVSKNLMNVSHTFALILVLDWSPPSLETIHLPVPLLDVLLPHLSVSAADAGQIMCHVLLDPECWNQLSEILHI